LIYFLAFTLIALDNATNSYLSANQSGFELTNKYINFSISKLDGQIVLSIKEKKELRPHPFSVNFSERNRGDITEIIETSTIDKYPDYGEIYLKVNYLEEFVEYRFRIDSISLYCETAIISKNKTEKEIELSFSISELENFDYLFYPGSNAVVPIKKLKRKIIKYREDIYIPMLSLYNSNKDYGMSLVAPFEIPKPSLSFSIDMRDVVVSYNHLRLTNNNKTKAAIYVVPHEGDWRPGLNFVLNKYSAFFNPKIENTKIGEGWYYLANPFDADAKIGDIANRTVRWIEFHGHFPFYGLYAPQKQNWGLLYNTDGILLSDWEEGAGAIRNSYDNMYKLMDLWHKYGIQVYLYFQCFEAWHQYAERYFVEDIAQDENGKPLPAWQFCNLMNPAPGRKWSSHIISQAKKLIERYPAIDGIFYDRMDYWNYDFAHDDGITLIDNKPAYMLGFALEKINDEIFDIFHKNKKGIWGNAPTSIEVCKNLDGIMAEGDIGFLYKFQYLGLVRPIIYLPYDKQPEETEKKLKYSLLCGAFPSITDGGKECQILDEKYLPLFELIKNRKWVLTKNPVEISEEFQSNIFQTPESNYVVIIIGSGKPRSATQLFTYNTLVTINIQDAKEIENAYLLSGDWAGVNRLEFKKFESKISINLPYHLSSSIIYLSKRKKYNLLRLSPPIFIKGKDEKLIFYVENFDSENPFPLVIETPWFKKIEKLISNVIKFQTKIPENIEGEVEIKIRYNGEEHKMSFWVLDPIVITPKEDIFIQDVDEKVPFVITNNTNEKVSVHLESRFIKGTGKIIPPNNIILQPFESKDTEFSITTKTEGEFYIIIEAEGQKITRSFSLKTGLFHEKSDLFFDDFKQDMKKWTISRGNWNVSNNIACASGPAHFAFIKEDWQDYVIQVKTRCKGSDDLAVDWLKSYIFFRLQDEANFYRFGIHGDAGLIDLLKFVNGKWIYLGSSPFSPQIDRWYTLRIELTGTKITGYINGEKIVEATDDTFLSGGIGIGVFEDYIRCDYKDVIVKKL
jgi:hypothetical protein